MFSSPTLSSRSTKQSSQPIVVDVMTTRRMIDEQTKTIEQLKHIIDELQLRHQRKERDFIKRMGNLYNDLQQTKKKMAHLIYKHQQQKKLDEDTTESSLLKKKSVRDVSMQTDDDDNVSSICPNCSMKLIDSSHCKDEDVVKLLSQLQSLTQMKSQEQPKYYTLQSEDDVEYISATPKPANVLPTGDSSFDQSLSSPALSTTDRSSTTSSCSHHRRSPSTKHNESSSSAYNTAESLPSSTYSDEIDTLERVLNAACTMYTTHNNLEHTIKLQEQLFRQRLRLRGITLDDDDDDDDNNNNNNNNNDNRSLSSEHFYDNIDDDETSDIEKQMNKITVSRCRLTPWHPKKQQQNVTLSTDDDEKPIKMTPSRVRFLDQHQPIVKRKSAKSSSRTNLAKITNNKRYYHPHVTNKKLLPPLSSNMLTVTIT